MLRKLNNDGLNNISGGLIMKVPTITNNGIVETYRVIDDSVKETGNTVDALKNAKKFNTLEEAAQHAKTTNQSGEIYDPFAKYNNQKVVHTPIVLSPTAPQFPM